MPNYVRTRITFEVSESKRKKILDFVKGDKSVFDFNKIIPCPESIEKAVESSDVHEAAIKWMKETPCDITDNEGLEKLLRKGSVFKAEHVRTGINNLLRFKIYGWYDWKCKFWGTKWNACDPNIDDYGNIIFETAWSAPVPIYKALSQRFPEVEFNIVYADEDTGYNCGIIVAKGGELSLEQYDGGSKESYDIAFDVWPEDKSSYRLVDGEYKYIEDEEDEEI